MKFAIRSLLTGLVMAASFTGCTSNEPNMLQPTGTAIVEGDSPLKMVAPDNGQITVYDVGDGRTIWTGAIKKGDTLMLDPVNKQLTLNGLACNDMPLGGGHTLKISFDHTN